MAAPKEHLPRAPVREALIDIQFEPSVSIEDVDRFVAVVRPHFSKVSNLWQALFGFMATGQQGEAEAKQTAVGRRLDRDGDPFVLQSRVGGFTLSRLSLWEMATASG